MHQTGAMRENDIGGRCEDKESGEEQKGNGANMEAAFVRGMKKNGGRLSSPIAAKCVFCHIRFDARPLHDRSPPSSLAAAVARATDVVHESQPSSHTECYK